MNDEQQELSSDLTVSDSATISEAQTVNAAELVKKELNERLSHLMQDFQQSMSEAMTSLTERYREDRRARLASEQTIVLRINKILRDLSRSIANDWRQVFRRFMDIATSEHADDVSLQTAIEELDAIEKESGHYHQTYRALLYWRTVYEKRTENGCNKFVEVLVEVLKELQRPDLIASIHHTMNSRCIAFTIDSKCIISISSRYSITMNSRCSI